MSYFMNHLLSIVAELNNYPAFCLVMAGILGVIFGSFLNVVILRVPAKMMADWRREAQEILAEDGSEAEQEDIPAPRIGGIEERSRCPGCGAAIHWYDNIPLISYLILLRGKCRACRMHISWQYPIIEALAGVGCVALTAHFGVGLPLLLGAILWLILLPLSVIDLRTMLLPDGMIYSLLWIGLLGSSMGWPSLPGVQQAIWGAAGGWVALWAFYWLFKLIRGKEGMGYGDFKLYAALGAWCGAIGLIPILVVATGAGLVGALIALVVRRNALGPLPFGPALAVGGLVQWVYPHWMDGALRALTHALH